MYFHRLTVHQQSRALICDTSIIVSKIDAPKELIRAWGLNPEEILTREALTKPYRTVIDKSQIEQNQIHQLTIALKQQMLKEIHENQSQRSINPCLSDGSPGEIRTHVKHIVSIFLLVKSCSDPGRSTINFVLRFCKKGVARDFIRMSTVELYKQLL